MLKKILVVILLALLLTSCGAGEPATEITLNATDFAYSPVSVKIPAGELVVLTLRNAGAVEHDFVIEKINVESELVSDSGSEAHHMHGTETNYDIHFSASVGKTSVIQFTVTEPGIYQFFCSVPGHKEAGMIGELVVVNDQ